MKITEKTKAYSKAAAFSLATLVSVLVPNLFAHATDAFDTAFTGLTTYVQTFLTTHVPEVFIILGGLTALGILYAIFKRRVGKKI